MEMESVINTLAGLVPTDDEIYVGEDGLAKCSRCHTPRQVRIKLPWNAADRVVNCLCQCMAEERDREEEERKRQAQMMEIRRYRDAGFPDREYEEWNFYNDDGATPGIRDAMLSYVKNFQDLRKTGKGLLLYGNVGTGKSFYAACIVNALIDRGYPCLMTNFSRLTNQISGMWEGKQEYIDSLGRLALIAIDDLGVERDTEFMNENVTTIIDSLYRSNVPMIITSNYTPKQLTEAEDIRKKRVFDRLLQVCHPVLVDGPSRRKEIGRHDFKEMNKLLGL